MGRRSRAASITVVPASVPGTVIDLMAVGHVGRLRASWSRPDDGGSPVTAVLVEVIEDGLEGQGDWTVFTAGPRTTSADIGGLAALKLWLERRRDAFFQPTDELDQPRGILLVGVQGAGKSLAAKATAGAWGLPLLRLDFGTLYNRYFGQTEQNLRTALATASVMAPCVLWVDEIEKAIAEGNNDQGVSQRLLGHLLTWMSEREASVFLVATANNIDRLPPELIRKGRLDEVFFVDLPSAEVRAEILRIHLQQRNLGPSEFDVERLAQHTQGFSGAELEQGIVSARYLARERGD